MSIDTIEQYAAELAAESSGSASSAENDQPETESQSSEQQGADVSEFDAGAVDAGTTEGAQEGDEEGQGETDQPAPESAKNARLKWKTAEGVEYDLPAEEVQKGYMRADDYTQKTQQHAVTVQQAAQQIAEQQQQAVQQVQQYQQHYGQLFAAQTQLQQVEQALQNTSYDADPDGYTRLHLHRSQLMEYAGKLGGAIQQVQTQAQQQAAQQAQHQQAEAIRLLEADAKAKGQKFDTAQVKAWESTATEYGYTPQELQGVNDIRVLRILRDFSELKALVAKKPEAIRQAATAPARKATATVAPDAFNQSMKRLDAEPTVESFARALALSRK